MKVYLADGTSFECGGYKALDSGGVVLTEDEKRKRVVGYVPADALVYVLPDDVEPGDSLGEDSDGDDDAGDEAEVDEREAEAGDGEAAGSDSDESARTAVEAGIDSEVAGVTGPVDGEAEHTHTDLVGRIGAVESRVDGLDGRVDAMTERLAAVASAGGGGAGETEADRDPEDPRNVRGIGEAYATRLRAAGIDTVSALREASDEELAAAAGVSARRVTDWKRRADRYAEPTASEDDAEPESDASTGRDADDGDANTGEAADDATDGE
ncbi:MULTISPECIES: DUF4332 domain-containing protein [Haloferax]|uniref:Helix-hairpin-helix domain-containing protein n=1 Tax=Haloferax massiliensis TaxID=1476858 RepID=A0A0D6JWX2_9EURY|nr:MULTISPECIES: DUF4332 domain-containing protein [Haloferax]MDS0242873.1 DUF4332 domain-containing protein [Haloferax sp. S2CR25]MDS0445994.1 DUF4332 domain-containing protein [Haloferax sp. S2CR25-2]CQR54132.1 hypothetical protein BN996_03955 [Haloferax massiliensis]